MTPAPTTADAVARITKLADNAPDGTVIVRVPLADLRLVLARLAECEADAARLNWLERDHNAKVFPTMLDGDFGVMVEAEHGRGFSLDGKVRQAIDAAREGVGHG